MSEKKYTPEEIFDKLLDGFNDKSGQSEVSYIHWVIQDAASNAQYNGGYCEDELNVLDSTFCELVDVIKCARKELKALRSAKKGDPE